MKILQTLVKYILLLIDDRKLLNEDLVAMLSAKATGSASRLFDGFFDPTPPDPRATMPLHTASWINAQAKEIEGGNIHTKSSAFDEGLFDHAKVYEVDITNERGDHKRVVAKLYHPLRGWYWGNIARYSGRRNLGKRGRDKIKEQWDAVPEHARSEEEHLAAWNKAGVSSPFSWGRISRRMPTPASLKEQFQKEDMPVEVLVSSLLQDNEGQRAISRDRDVLYLRQELAVMKAVKEDPHDHRSQLYLNEGKDGLEKRIKLFEGKEREVIMGMLHTVDDLSLRMTHDLEISPREIERSEKKVYPSQLDHRLTTNIRAFYEWSALKGYFLKPDESESSAKITQE